MFPTFAGIVHLLIFCAPFIIKMDKKEPSESE